MDVQMLWQLVHCVLVDSDQHSIDFLGRGEVFLGGDLWGSLLGLVISLNQTIYLWLGLQRALFEVLLNPQVKFNLHGLWLLEIDFL